MHLCSVEETPMLVPISLLILTLLALLVIGFYSAKRRMIDKDIPPDVRPDDPPPSPDVPPYVRGEELGVRRRQSNGVPLR